LSLGGESIGSELAGECRTMLVQMLNLLIKVVAVTFGDGRIVLQVCQLIPRIRLVAITIILIVVVR
jgi:hypothetical protein